MNSPGQAMRLIEPLGLLAAHEARAAVAAGLALPLASGGACTIVRLIDADTKLVAAPDLPEDWHAEAARLAAAVPPWAGLPARPSVMGILNVTPDSFSDGGQHLDPGRAAARAAEMVEAGAAMLDLGAESTRPGRAPRLAPRRSGRACCPSSGGSRASACRSRWTRATPRPWRLPWMPARMR